jgi:hypothetical protein
MEDTMVVAAFISRLPERVSWSLGTNEQSSKGDSWRGLIRELAAVEHEPLTISMTFLLELDAPSQQEAEQ